MMSEITIKAFYELLRAGLWEKEYRFSTYDRVNFMELYRLAKDQSVLGVLLSGIEQCRKNDIQLVGLPQELLLQWIGTVQILEQHNVAMNKFIGKLVDKMRQADIYTLLVKGQGIAQCYEKPLWRNCGDIDFFLSEENYNKAKSFLCPLATEIEPEGRYLKHSAFTIDGWTVELHGNLRTRHSMRMDKGIDEVQKDTFQNNNVRTIRLGNTDVFLPSPDNDVIFIFTHFLKHFFGGGIGVRQLCDWCRLMWTYRSEIKQKLLETRLRKMGILSEWKAFAAYAVRYLGMPPEAMPMYSAEKKWQRKADKISKIILQSGTFGHADLSYIHRDSLMLRKIKSFWKGTKERFRLISVFPLDALAFYAFFLVNRSDATMKGEL